MTLAFLDTSVVLRHIFNDLKPYPHLDRFDKLFSSELMRVEALRAIDRGRLRHQWDSAAIALRVRLLIAFNASVEFISIQQPILRRAAEPFPTVVGTLDALHIATALLTQNQLNQPLLFLTHDLKQGLAATSTGLTSEGF